MKRQDIIDIIKIAGAVAAALLAPVALTALLWLCHYAGFPM